MYVVLACIAAVIALFVAGLGIFLSYLIWSGRRPELRSRLQRWTVLDIGIVAVFLISTLFLFADLIGVVRDRDAYPYYHYGYLLSGFVYHLLSGGMLFLRLAIALGWSEKKSEGSPLPQDDHPEP